MSVLRERVLGMPGMETAARRAIDARSLARVARDRARLRQLSADREDLLLNVGAGTNHLAGWLSLDVRPDGQGMGMDAAQPWPLAGGCAAAVNSEHMVEHLGPDAARAYFAEAFRVLRPGGVIRTSTPNLRGLCDLLVEGDPRILSLHRAHGYAAATHGQMVNNYVYSWGHRHVYDFESLERLQREIGFEEVEEAGYGRSRHPLLDGIDRHDPEGLERSVLWVDAVKPG